MTPLQHSVIRCSTEKTRLSCVAYMLFQTRSSIIPTSQVMRNLLVMFIWFGSVACQGHWSKIDCKSETWTLRLQQLSIGSLPNLLSSWPPSQKCPGAKNHLIIHRVLQENTLKIFLLEGTRPKAKKFCINNCYAECALLPNLTAIFHS